MSDDVIEFRAGDGRPLNLIHVTGPRAPEKGPVLLVHGAGVRADIFRAPSGRTVVDELLDAGWDVWLENWRASIDFAPNRWTLDQAAVLDHPAAVRTVLDRTGAERLRAIVHCQGSTSFVLAAVAGLLPEVEVVVSNAVALHPVVNRRAQAKLRWMIPPAARKIGYLDPQWGVTGAPWLLPKAVTAWVRLTHRECTNTVCRLASFTYGTGMPTLWRHENLNAATHEWLSHEFAACPLSFFEQMTASVRAGQLLPVEGRPELPPAPADVAPKTTARFAFFAGALNSCFEPESQRRSHAWFDRHDPRRGHALHVVEDYGHLDMFMGTHAHRDVFPLMLAELERA